MHPHAVASSRHETALAQIREMARYGGLRDSKAVVNVADAHFVVAEQRKDTQSRFVGYATGRIYSPRRISPPATAKSCCRPTLLLVSGLYPSGSERKRCGHVGHTGQ